MVQNDEHQPLRSSWRMFTEETSMHGMKYLYQPGVHMIRRVIWFLLIAGWFGYFCYAARLFITDMVQRKISTKVTVSKGNNLVFPTVTICNKNIWRLGYLGNLSSELGSSKIFDVISDLYNIDNEIALSERRYNWSDPMYAPIAALTSEDVEQIVKEAYHPLDQTLLVCSSKGIEYNCSESMQVVLTDAGYCYQFNGDGSFKTKTTGLSGGVSFVLNAMINEYSIGPSTFSEGFFVALHDFHEVPQVMELGNGIAPGTHVIMAVQKSETIREPPPADGGKANCFDTVNLPNPLKFYSQYSYSACVSECKTEYVIENCQCRDMFQPALYDAPVCSFLNMTECSITALDLFRVDPEGADKCQCAEPCIETEYSAKISTFSFPGKNYANQSGYTDEMTAIVRQNYVMLNIYYGKLSFQRLEEYVPYTVEDAIANIGGTLGCCIGASILTLFEFIEFGILSLINRIKRIRKGRVTTVTEVKPITKE